MAEKKFDLIIIGGGPAGLSEAIYASRYKMKTLVFSKKIGGTISEAHNVENYPGFDSISGAQLMEKFESQAKKFGTEIIYDEIVNVEKKDDEFILQTYSSEKYETKFLLLAMGTDHKKLNIPGEEELLGRGVSYCATCDAAFFKDKTVAVIGGNDSAAQSSIILSEYAKKVYLIYRKEKLRCEPTWIEKIEANSKIEIIYNTNVKQVIGEHKVEKIKLDNEKEIILDGLFIEIGLIPSTVIANKLGVKMDADGYIIVDATQKTSADKIYAAGDITTASNKFWQVITASAEGALASNSIYKDLKKSQFKK